MSQDDGVVSGGEGVRRRLAAVLEAPGLSGVVSTATTPTRVEPVLPVADEVAPLLPAGGLRRGSAVSVSGSTSLLLAVMARASAAGAWCAVVGVPKLGLLAAREAGVALDRLMLVPDVDGQTWARVVDIMVEGCEVVVVAPPVTRVTPQVASRLVARARTDRAVIINFGSTAWPGADVVLSPVASTWYGLGTGHGRLRHRALEVRSIGAGLAGGRTATLYPHGYPDARDVAAAGTDRPSLRAVA